MTRAIMIGFLLGLTLAGLAALATKPAAAYLLRALDIGQKPGPVTTTDHTTGNDQ